MLNDKLKLHIIEYIYMRDIFEYYLNRVKHRVAFSIDWIFHISMALSIGMLKRSQSRDVIPLNYNANNNKNNRMCIHTNHPITKQNWTWNDNNNNKLQQNIIVLSTMSVVEHFSKWH